MCVRRSVSVSLLEGEFDEFVEVSRSKCLYMSKDIMGVKGILRRIFHRIPAQPSLSASGVVGSPKGGGRDAVAVWESWVI